MGNPNQQYQFPEQKKIQKTVVQIPKKPTLGEQIVHTIVDSGGVWWLLGFASIGVVTIFKKKILEFFGVEIKRVSK